MLKIKQKNWPAKKNFQTNTEGGEKLWDSDLQRI